MKLKIITACTGLVLAVMLLALVGCTTQDERSQEIRVLHSKSFNWLDSIDWVDKAGDNQKTLSFGNGKSGHIIFLLNSFLMTNDSAYLEKARVMSKELTSFLVQLDTVTAKPGDLTLYKDIGGSIFALTELYKVTEELELKEAAIAGLGYTIANQDSTGSWGNGNDILFGDAGTGLLLIYGYENLNSENALEHASRVGEVLIERAIKTEAGLNWTRKQGDEFYLPNFSHGTSGIGYFLTKLYQVTKDARFLDAAIEAYTFLEVESVADSIMLLPYGVPDLGWSNPYDIGWAHGPAGVARFCYAMYDVTGEEKYMEGLHKCYEALKQSGVPHNPNPMFGYETFPVDLRFGLASVADFLLDYSNVSKDKNVVADAASVCDALIVRASLDQGGAYWPIPPYEFMRTEADAVSYSGYFYGSTGVLIPLMKYVCLKEGKDFINYLDNPF